MKVSQAKPIYLSPEIDITDIKRSTLNDKVQRYSAAAGVVEFIWSDDSQRNHCHDYFCESVQRSP